MSKALNMALHYAGEGFRVLPWRVTDDGRKVPLIKGWQNEATNDEGTVRSWWAKNPGANVGIVCGQQPNGVNLVLFDVDVKKDAGGMESLQRFIEAHGAFPRTYRNDTPSGGQHLLFRLPATIPAPNTTSKLAPGIDTKGEGGWVAMPPSVVNGSEYRGQERFAVSAIAGAPRWLIEALTPADKRQAQAVPAEAVGAGTFDKILRKYVQEAGAGSRNASGFAMAVQLKDNGASIDEAAVYMQEYQREVERSGDHPYTMEEAEASLASAYSKPAREPWTRAGGDGAPGQPGYFSAHDPTVTGKTEPAGEDEEHRGRFGLTDLGNAERLVRDHGENLRYCYPWRAWLVWNGRMWRRDEGGAIERRAKKTVRQMQRDAAAIEDAEKKQKLFKHAVQSEADKRIRALISLAQSEPSVPVEPDELDRGEWLLNVKNGTVDLRAGTMRPHQREDLITKIAPVEFEREATCPRFEQFLREVFTDGQGSPDQALIDYVQRALGYSMSASVREQVFFILYGIGANGKGTLLDVVQQILGDYAGEARSELLMKQKRQAAAPSEDEADLHGRRLVKASETDAGRAFSEALVKRLTGGDRIKARRLHGHLFEFAPTHKLFLLTNHKPEITGTDYAIWRRVHMIPFNACFEGKAADAMLKEKLLQEAPGILNWLIAGFLAWQTDGLNAPEAVVQATNAYRASMDKLAQFVDDCVVTFGDGITGRVGATALYQAYRTWCGDNGEIPETQTRFGDRMAERGMPKKRTGAGWVYTGIGLRAATSDDGERPSGRESSTEAPF